MDCWGVFRRVNGVVLVLAALFYGGAVSAQTYVEAYNMCSNNAHAAVKAECNFGVVYQNFYQGCMGQYGYTDDSEVDSSAYDRYMQAYNYCRATADTSAKTQCQYGQGFNAYYLQCMAGYGFDANGNPIASAPSLSSPSGGGGQSQGEGKFEFSF